MNFRLPTLALLLTFVVSGCTDDNGVTSSAKKKTAQAVLTQLADTLVVSYQHITNIVGPHCDKSKGEGACFQAEISLTSPVDVAGDDWEIYFSHIAPVQSFVSDSLVIEHINGDLHKLTLAKGSEGFEAGQRKSILITAIFWSVSEFDLMPNYILNKPGIEPQIIASTRSVNDAETGLETLPFVKPYTDEETQFRRMPGEKTQWATSEVLFENNAKLGVSNEQISGVIIPTPQQIILPKINAQLDVSPGININFNGLAQDKLASVITRLELLGLRQSKIGIAVDLSLDTDAGIAGSYRLVVNQHGISIKGSDISGVYYGLQSVAALITLGSNYLPLVSIIDQPHYEFRGMHVDVARNFMSKEFIIKLLDQMAAYKLNKLHLHLADDEGWRLQIPGLPELTDIGGNRCLDLSEQHCLLPQLGAGIDINSAINGYYTVADYQEILRAASARHIQVIPSLDMPGHSRSSVKAMTARYHHYIGRGEVNKANEFLLYDLNDKTEYSSVQFYNDNTINVCMESSYVFIDKVMDEVKEIHRTAQHPLTRYHIGADETAGAWLESPICQNFVANNSRGITNIEQLGAYFIERVAKILSNKGIETAGWNDGLMHTNAANMPDVVQANAWDNLFWGGHSSVHKMLNQGWQVVFSSPEVLYFDFPYEADPKEHGYYWASRHTNTRKVFELMPDNLPVHAEVWRDRMDVPFSSVDDKNTVLAQGKSLSGIQGQLWTESTRSESMAEYKIYPRLLALAERAWHKADWAVAYQPQGQVYSSSSGYFSSQQRGQRNRQWQQFAKTVALKEMPKLSLAGINYRIATVGAKVIDGILHANSIFPQTAIEYRVKQGEWQPYIQPIAVSGDIEIRGTTDNGKRKGRILKLNQ
ncbi:MAG: carbohydate-binding domain-containing protein [Psychrobium sp.]|nr:carbohydate-binding domain-containing protein [Psychrobium sp.]